MTGYVQRVEVGSRTLFAKYSYLGASLVSVLRGKCGDWNEVRGAQAVYVAAPGSLLEREAAQLGLLNRLGLPRVQRVAGFRRGVLFTDVVPGASLAQLLCDDPKRSGDLLWRTWTQVRELHRSEMAQRMTHSVAIEERSIAGIFVRKFTGVGFPVYLDRLVTQWGDHPGEQDELVAVLRRVVTRLHRLRGPAATATALVYGDLKPEHVIFEREALASDRPVFIDPGLSCAPVTVDAAKLVSRTILLMIGVRPRNGTAKTLGDGLAAFVHDQTQVLPATVRREWVRELLLLWAMDTVNILTTYLSAPAGLPLPAHAKAALSQGRTLWALVDKVSVELAAGADPQSVWRLGLIDAVGDAQCAVTA